MIITVKIDSEVVAEIRNALQIIMGQAELIIAKEWSNNRPDRIIKQVKRIDKLLPGKIQMSEEKNCPNCNSILDFQGDNYICHGCGQVYPITPPQKKEGRINGSYRKN